MSGICLLFAIVCGMFAPPDQWTETVDVNEYLGVALELSVDLKVAKAAGYFFTDDDPVIVYRPKAVDVLAEDAAIVHVEEIAEDPPLEEPAAVDVSATELQEPAGQGSLI